MAFGTATSKKFSRINPREKRHHSIARTSPRKSRSSNITSAVSRATSAPCASEIDTSACTGRRVVETVADHRHDSAALLQRAHYRGLVLRQHAGMHVRDAQYRASACAAAGPSPVARCTSRTPCASSQRTTAALSSRAPS